MILAQNGTHIPEGILADHANKQRGGVDIEDIPAVVRKFGLQAELVQLDVEAISERIARGIFPIVYLNRSYFGKRSGLDRKTALATAIVPIRVSAHLSRCTIRLMGKDGACPEKGLQPRSVTCAIGALCASHENAP
jgi:hypothetical protein